MDISWYEIIVLFLVSPFLLFRYTEIPVWCFRKAKQWPASVMIFVSAIILLCLAALVATASDFAWDVRIISFGIAALACWIHYSYHTFKNKDQTDSDN